MDIREFFTEAEIRAMKERIVRETSFASFMTDQVVTDQDGETTRYRSVEPTIRSEIHNHCKQELELFIKQTVKDVIHKILQEQITRAAERFTKNLCDQLDKITEKTNWYWSVN